MEVNKILSADVLDIIFEGKNKEYGAYDLRKTYNKRLTTALLVTAGIGLIIFLGSFLASVLHSTNDHDMNVKDLSLSKVKPPEKKPPPPPPPKPKIPPPPKLETIKFTPPKVVKDNEVKPDEKPPENKDLDKPVQIDTKSQEGIKSDIVPTTTDNSNAVEVPKEDPNQIFTKVEIEASFPGGLAAWKRYLEKNLDAQVPTNNSAPEGTYQVIVQFVVSKDGSLSDIKCVQDPGYGTCEEAIKVIKNGPHWNPGQQNGHEVNSLHQQPVTFIVQE